MAIGSRYSHRISVVHVDDEVSYRDSVLRVVDAQDDMVCVGSFSDVESLLNSDLVGFNILLLDNGLGPGRSGVDALKDIKDQWPTINVVMLTQFEPEELLFEAIKNGSLGYLYKGAEKLDVTMDRLREIDAGGAAMTPGVARMLLAHVAQLSIRFDLLTKRENEVMSLVVEGKTNPQIGRKLYIASDTVAFHIRNIYSKLHVHTKGELIKMVMQEKHGSTRVLRPKLDTTEDPGQIKIGENRRLMFTLSATKSRHRRDFTVAVMVPAGLELTAATTDVGAFDINSNLWTVPSKAYTDKAELTVTVSGMRPGLHVIRAFVAYCPTAILPNDASAAIRVL